MFRVIGSAIGVSSFIIVLGACGHEVPINTAAAKEVAAPRSEDAPLAAHSGDSMLDHHSNGGERPPLEIEFLAGAASSAAGSMSATLQLRNNTKTAQHIGYVVQVLDIAGKDVVTPIVVVDVAVAENAVKSTQAVEIPALPDGYHWLLATAQDQISGLTGPGEAFIRVDKGAATLVTYAEWYFNSGAESFGQAG